MLDIKLSLPFLSLSRKILLDLKFAVFFIYFTQIRHADLILFIFIIEILFFLKLSQSESFETVIN